MNVLILVFVFIACVTSSTIAAKFMATAVTQQATANPDCSLFSIDSNTGATKSIQKLGTLQGCAPILEFDWAQNQFYTAETFYIPGRGFQSISFLKYDVSGSLLDNITSTSAIGAGTVDFNTSPPSILAAAPDGQQRLTVSRVNFLARKVYPVWNSRLQFVWRSTVAYSSDSNYLVVVNSNRNISLVDTNGWNVLKTIPFTFDVSCIRFIDDGRGLKLAVVSTGTQGVAMTLIDVPSMKVHLLTQVIGVANGPCAGFDPSSKSFYFFVFNGGSPFAFYITSVNVQTGVAGPKVQLLYPYNYFWPSAASIIP